MLQQRGFLTIAPRCPWLGEVGGTFIQEGLTRNKIESIICIDLKYCEVLSGPVLFNAMPENMDHFLSSRRALLYGARTGLDTRVNISTIILLFLINKKMYPLLVAVIVAGSILTPYACQAS